MKKLSFLLVACLIVLGTYSCKTDDVVDIVTDPFADVIGFEMSWDGSPFITTEFSHLKNEITGNDVFIFEKNDENLVLTLNNLEPGNYDTGDLGAGGKLFEVTYGISEFLSGDLNIAESDETNRTLKGDFEFQFFDLVNSDTITISGGLFNITY